MYGDLDGYYLSCVKGTAKDGFAGIASATMEELERDTCIRRIASQSFQELSFVVSTQTSKRNPRSFEI